MGRKGKHHKPPYSSSDPFLYQTLTHVQLVGGLDPLSLTATRKSRLQVTKCPRPRPKRLNATVTNPAVGITYPFLRQTTPVTARKSAASPREPTHESQALHTMSLCAARSVRSLRSRSRASPVREMRRRTSGEQQPLPTQDPQEAKMRDRFQYRCNSAAKRCAICEGRFGLIRYYSWQTALCSRKCADRFKARREDDRRFLPRIQAA
jgi:hypothetical protein